MPLKPKTATATNSSSGSGRSVLFVDGGGADAEEVSSDELIRRDKPMVYHFENHRSTPRTRE